MFHNSNHIVLGVVPYSNPYYYYNCRHHRRCTKKQHEHTFFLQGMLPKDNLHHSEHRKSDNNTGWDSEYKGIHKNQDRNEYWYKNSLTANSLENNFLPGNTQLKLPY